MLTSKNQLRMDTKEQRLKLRNELDSWIKSADCVFAETSFPSISVGYEIALALQLNKPVLMLYTDVFLPSLISPSTNKMIFAEKYTKTSLKEIIKDFLHYVESAEGIRFTMFITPDLSHTSTMLLKKIKFQKLPTFAPSSART